MKTLSALLLCLISLTPSCVQSTATAELRNEKEAAAVASANRWWLEFTFAPEPVKAGTVTEAHTIVTKTGRTINVKRHVQTKKDELQDAEDFRFMTEKRAEVAGFSVKGKTLIVATNLPAANVALARELCEDMGAFIWANPYRGMYGLQNIVILGANGKEMSSRTGLKGQVL